MISLPSKNEKKNPLLISFVKFLTLICIVRWNLEKHLGFHVCSCSGLNIPEVHACLFIPEVQVLDLKIAKTNLFLKMYRKPTKDSVIHYSCN